MPGLRHEPSERDLGQPQDDALSRQDLICFVIFCVLFLVIFREFVFTDRIFFERDTTLIEIPARKLTVELLKEGHFALWTDAYGNGQPFLANPKNAIFYPTTWLYLILPLVAAFKLHYLLHVLFGWLGLYILGRSYTQSRRAAFLGASLFAFSGMYLSSFEFYNHIAALAWMPWVLWLAHRDGRPGPGRYLWPALLWTLMILAGAPEFVLMTIVLVAGQAVFTAGPWKVRLSRAAVPLALAALFSAAQVLPSLELLGRTDRSVHDTQWPLELVQLLNLPFPHVLGNDREPGHNEYWGRHLFDQQLPLYYSLYMGFGSLALAIMGLKRRRDRRRKVLLLLACLFFLLACGRYSPFFFLFRLTPFLSSIRYPVKFFMGSVFCLSILAGFGFDQVTSRGPGRPRRAWVFAAAVSGLGWLAFELFKGQVLRALNAIFMIENEASFSALSRSIETGLVLLAVTAVVLALLELAKKPARLLSWPLLALAVLDPAFHNRYVNPTVPASFFEAQAVPGLPAAPLAIYRDETYIPAFEAAMGDTVRLHRFLRASLYPFTGLGDGIRYVLNWDFYGTYPRSYRELSEAVQTMPPGERLKILASAGCAVYLGRQPLSSPATARRLEIEGTSVWLEGVAGIGRRPYVASRTIQAAEAKDRIRLLAAEGFDPRRAVITKIDPRLPMPAGSASEKPGVIVVRAEVQGKGRYSASLSRDGVVVFPGNAAPGWQASIDGRKAEIFEANLVSKGVRVPAGDHEIVIRYLPASFEWGAAISLISIAVVTAGAGVLGRGARKRVRRASP